MPENLREIGSLFKKMDEYAEEKAKTGEPFLREELKLIKAFIRRWPEASWDDIKQWAGKRD